MSYYISMPHLVKQNILVNFTTDIFRYYMVFVSSI